MATISETFTLTWTIKLRYMRPIIGATTPSAAIERRWRRYA
jgi:hypothetical protein